MKFWFTVLVVKHSRATVFACGIDREYTSCDP